MPYITGNSIALSVTFTQNGGNFPPVDPPTVTCYVMDPGGVVTSYVYGTSAQVIRLSTGSYSCQVNASAAGLWRYRWCGLGLALGGTVAAEGAFTVDPSPFNSGALLTEQSQNITRE